MGWSSGTDVCIQVWNLLRKHVPDKQKPKVLSKLIDILSNHDWDCLEEIEQEWPESVPALKLSLGNDYEPIE